MHRPPDPGGGAVLHLGLALLVCHELDAVRHDEWRVLPLTSWLPPDTGYVVFVLAHLPLVALLTWSLAQPRLASRTQRALAAFLIVHAALHALYQHHPHYHFSGWLSHGLVAAAALAGAAHLWQHYRLARSSSSA